MKLTDISYILVAFSYPTILGASGAQGSNPTVYGAVLTQLTNFIVPFADLGTLFLVGTDSNNQLAVWSQDSDLASAPALLSIVRMSSGVVVATSVLAAPDSSILFISGWASASNVQFSSAWTYASLSSPFLAAFHVVTQQFVQVALADCAETSSCIVDQMGNANLAWSSILHLRSQQVAWSYCSSSQQCAIEYLSYQEGGLSRYNTRQFSASVLQYPQIGINSANGVVWFYALWNGVALTLDQNQVLTSSHDTTAQLQSLVAIPISYSAADSSSLTPLVCSVS